MKTTAQQGKAAKKFADLPNGEPEEILLENLEKEYTELHSCS